MSSVLIGAIADDDTGASDLGGMLAAQGVRTIVTIGLPETTDFQRWYSGAEAIIIGSGTRALPPSEASRLTGKAADLLAQRTPSIYYIKYCSTFDSTPQGNIGPSIDAVMDRFGLDFTIAVPALPVNGRTTYMGHHFVGTQLLSDSSMRDHPLTPMTGSNLVAWLQRQTMRKVGLCAYDIVHQGPAELARRFQQLREHDCRIAIVDCLVDSDVKTIGEAARKLQLVTGSSCLGSVLPAILRRGQPSSKRGDEWLQLPAGSGSATLLIAGSCSAATRAQNTLWRTQHPGEYLQLNAADMLARDWDLRGVAEFACECLARGRDCLLATTAEPADMHAMHRAASSRGFDPLGAGLCISSGLAAVASAILERCPVAGLVLAGGETSGAISRALELGAVRVGRNVDSGVPMCYALGKYQLPVVLKSGNFGSEDFYARAIAAISSFQTYFA